MAAMQCPIRVRTPAQFLLLLVALHTLGCAGVFQEDSPRRSTDDPAESAESDVEAAPEGDILDYLAARGYDLLDIASVRIAVGPGLLAHARMTRWIAAGAGYIGRAEAWGTGFEMGNYGLGWMLREGGVWTERRAEVGLFAFYYCESEPHRIGGNRETFAPECRGPFDVGAELHLALIGLAAEVRPDQAIDFVVGLLGFDPLEDD